LVAQLKVLAHFHLKLIVGKRNSCPRHECESGNSSDSNSDRDRDSESRTTTTKEGERHEPHFFAAYLLNTDTHTYKDKIVADVLHTYVSQCVELNLQHI